jgi:hypothetical protein
MAVIELTTQRDVNSRDAQKGASPHSAKRRPSMTMKADALRCIYRDLGFRAFILAGSDLSITKFSRILPLTQISLIFSLDSYGTFQIIKICRNL